MLAQLESHIHNQGWTVLAVYRSEYTAHDSIEGIVLWEEKDDTGRRQYGVHAFFIAGDGTTHVIGGDYFPIFPRTGMDERTARTNAEHRFLGRAGLLLSAHGTRA